MEVVVEQLSPAARAQLRFFLRFREQPLTVWGQLGANRWRYAVLLATMCICGAVLYLCVGQIGPAFIGVAFATAVVRDIGTFRRAALGWLVTRSVIDWQRVQQLLASDDSSRVVE
jgi:hypothetical protein